MIILLLGLFTNITLPASRMQKWQGYIHLYFIAIHLVYLFFSSSMMVNKTNINRFKTFAWCKYLSNGWINTIQINHVDLCSSDVQHNDDFTLCCDQTQQWQCV